MTIYSTNLTCPNCSDHTMMLSTYMEDPASHGSANCNGCGFNFILTSEVIKTYKIIKENVSGCTTICRVCYEIQQDGDGVCKCGSPAKDHIAQSSPAHDYVEVYNLLCDGYCQNTNHLCKQHRSAKHRVHLFALTPAVED